MVYATVDDEIYALYFENYKYIRNKDYVAASDDNVEEIEKAEYELPRLARIAKYNWKTNRFVDGKSDVIGGVDAYEFIRYKAERRTLGVVGLERVSDKVKERVDKLLREGTIEKNRKIVPAPPPR